MKRNIKFFTIVISLLLLSAIILTGCMFAIAADNGEMKPYDLNGQKEDSDSSGGNIVEDAPQAQKPLHGRFGEYLHEDGTAVTVFSEEQYAELKAVRESDKRNPLTYEEILFLVNDSINLYFAYDEIILTNANRDHVIPLLTNQSGNARVIKTGYKGASAYETYNEAQIAYNEMLTNIYEIIYYRIYMHDAGFEMVHHTYHSGKDNIFGNRYNGNLGMISSAVQMGRYQMLAIDGATFSGIDNEEKLCDEYKTLLEWKRMYEADAIIDYEHYPYLNSAVLCTSILNTVRRPMEYKFYIAGPKNDPAQQIYPTAELENMMPHREYIYQATSLDASLQPGFSLNYENGRVAMSQSKFTSFAMIGTFDEHDDVLKMYFENYSYVFYKCEKGYVYSAENSKPASGGFDFVDGLLFEMIHPGVSTEPNPEPPTNDKTEPDIEKEQWAYLKYASGSDYATLMYPDGGQYIAEGSYAKEADKLVFVFKTADDVYTYYFHYRKDRVYVFDKELSEAVPGYGFEDEMEFVLTEYEGGSCFLELLEFKEGHPTDTHAADFERYYPDELFSLYDLSKIVTWDEIYAAEQNLLKNNANFYNEQLPPLYLMIKELAISKEDFVKVADDISEEQIEWLFATDEAGVMKHLKADWAFYHEGRLYNIFELAELDKDLIIELRECGDLNEFIAYMESLNVEFEALEIIKNAGK